MWVILAAGTAVFYALHGAWSKRVSARVGALAGAWTFFLCALPFLAVYLWFEGVPPVGPRFWSILGVNLLLNLVASSLFVSAVRSGDLGVTYPLLALTPVFVIPVEFVLAGDLPGRWGAVGICMVVVGIYLLNFSGMKAGFSAPFRALVRSPGARRSLVVAVLWSVSGTLDRMAVLESSPGFYGVGLAGGLSLLFLPVLRWQHGRGVAVATAADKEGRSPSRSAKGAAPMKAVLGSRAMFPVHGLLFALMFILQMEALELALASYVLSIKRTGAILAVVLGWLAFREGSVATRLVGTGVTLLGITILVVWG